MKQGIIGAVIILFLSAISQPVQAQSNLDFELGLKGWETTGNVSIAKSGAQHGSNSAQIGKGYGKLQMRVNVLPLSLVQFHGYFRSDARGVKGYSFISFYDGQKKLLLTYKGKAMDSTAWQETGDYTETPPNTRYMEIGIESDPANKGSIYADNYTVGNDTDMMKPKPPPMCDLDEYMRPMWRSDTIYNETVLLYSAGGRPAEGKLLYMPSKILSVKKFDLGATYSAGKDYTLNGNVITKVNGSPIPYTSDTAFDFKKDAAWYNLQSQWVVVTYTHHDKWDGPVPVYKAGKLPHTMAKLKAHAPLKIVAYGMSITRGMDVSNYDWAPPYMPPYVDLFATQLSKLYHDKNIKMYNAGLPGSTVNWGAQYADKYVDPLKPDLVILDFGMNDFWGTSPAQFIGYVKAMVKKIKQGNPDVEFLLLTNMRFDPDYILESNKFRAMYTANLKGYGPLLQQMETTGVINLDMYTLSDAIYKKKKAKDCLVNPLHPNDYLARWYAQGLTALFTAK